MKTLMRVLLPIVAVAAACSPVMYGKIDAPSVVITQQFAAINGVPTPANPIAVPPIAFRFNIGDITINEGDKDSSLTLNRAVVSMGQSPPPTTTLKFEQIDVLSVSVTPPGGGAAVEIARYDRSAGVGSLSPDAESITFAPTTQTNLLGFLSQKSLQVTISGTGKPPGPSGAWTPEVILDFHVIAQENVL